MKFIHFLGLIAFFGETQQIQMHRSIDQTLEDSKRRRVEESLKKEQIQAGDSPEVIAAKVEAQQASKDNSTTPFKDPESVTAADALQSVISTPVINATAEKEQAKEALNSNSVVTASVKGDASAVPAGAVPATAAAIAGQTEHVKEVNATATPSSNTTTSNSTTPTATSGSTTTTTTTPTTTTSSPAATSTSTPASTGGGGVASAYDMEVFKQNNLARTDPKSFIPLLEARLSKFDGKLYKEAGQIDLLTNEGVDVVNELIEFLKTQPAVPELVWQNEMMPASKDHVIDTGPDGITGHTGTDGSQPSQRVAKYVEVQGMSGENIAYGNQTAQQVLISLMIDDGVPSRGHRSNVFQKLFKKMSAYTGTHKTYGTQTVINYNGDDTQSKAFLAEAAKFPAAPAGATGYSTTSAVEMGETAFIKTSTRTYTQADGSELEKKTVVETQDFI